MFHCSSVVPLLFNFSTLNCRQRKISIDDWKELEKKQTETNNNVVTFFPDATNTLNKMAVFLCTHFIDQRIINPGKYFGLLTMFASTYISAGVFCRTSNAEFLYKSATRLRKPSTRIFLAKAVSWCYNIPTKGSFLVLGSSYLSAGKIRVVKGSKLRRNKYDPLHAN